MHQSETEHYRFSLDDSFCHLHAQDRMGMKYTGEMNCDNVFF